MLRNIESIERNQPHAALLLDVCRRKPDTFISIGELQRTFGWSPRSTLPAVVQARKQLKDDALYTISFEEGIVYETARVTVGERIVPSGFRPDPNWLSEFPERRDLGDLLKRLRFATVVSHTKAAPLLIPSEHFLLIRLLANRAENKVSTMGELSLLVPKLAQKLTAETQGEWAVVSERRGGLYYMLKHNTV
jgi:hypothetical protein